MADSWHLEILEQGCDAWNGWRRKHPKSVPDLSTISLAETDLRGHDFAGADLTNSDLSGADLSGACLDGACLYNVDARKARFDGASLVEADLTRGLFDEASFRGACLDRITALQTMIGNADLGEASFADAQLSDTVFSEATMENTSFAGAELHRVELCRCDLSSCDFSGSKFQESRFDEARLAGVDLCDLDLAESIFFRADLSGARLCGAHCGLVDFSESTLRGADLSGADLTTTELRDADLRDACLDGADLTNASLVRAQVEGASFEGCIVYGVSAWDLKGTPKNQRDLVITPEEQADITVDDLEVAQVLYLVYSNAKIRQFMNQCTERNVLILGRFSPPERKAVLEGLRERLRAMGYVPIVFDFDKPLDRDLTETVQTLAGLSKFVIVDLTSPKSTPLEMEATVKQFKIPYVPIIDKTVDDRPFAMFSDLANSFHWVLKPVQYRGREQLLEHLEMAVVEPACVKHEELRRQKASTEIAMISIDEMLAARGRMPPRR